MEETMAEATPEQALQIALMRAMVANKHHIPLRGIGKTPGMKCAGLLVDWEALAAMEVTPDLFTGYLHLLTSGHAAGKRLGCDEEPLNTDGPGFQAWERKLHDLPESKKAEMRAHIYQDLGINDPAAAEEAKVKAKKNWFSKIFGGPDKPK
jgi:hypothetical protein